MSFDLGNLLQSQLGGVLSQFLTQNGESAENSAKAAGLALPAVVAGLLKHIGGNPGNAAGLFDLIKGSAGSQLNNAVAQAGEGGSGLGGLIEWGQAKLPELLGGSAAAVSGQIAQESGISKTSAGSLLSLALPLVLSVLRGKAQSDNLSQGQLLGLLGQQQNWLSGSLSNGLLSALGIGSLGSLFGNLSGLIGGAGTAASAAAGSAAAASAAAVKKGSGLDKWIALVLAALLALFAFKSCGGKDGQADMMPASDVAASDVADMASDAEAGFASDTVEPAAASDQAVAAEASEPAASEPAAASEASAPAAAGAEENARVSYENGVAKFYFATAKADVPEGAESIVADVIAAGKEGKKLVISGFTDSTGNAAANERLSKRRADAVKAFFEAQGVDAANIELRKPESTTGAQGNDAEGRRVEVSVEG